MANEGSQNEEEKVIYDPMISSFYEQNEESQPEKTQDELDEEAKALEQENLDKQKADEEQERLRVEEEEKAKLHVENNVPAQQKETEKPKSWDADLNEQSKFIIDKLSKGEDKEIYDILKNKYGYSNLTDDEKIFEYMLQKNPHLDNDDLAFKLANEYGIGATPIDEVDMTDDVKKEMKRQEIERKGLLTEAKKYFDDKAASIEIPSLPSLLDLDEGYKEYIASKEESVKQQELKMQQQEALDQEIAQTITKINNTSQEIEALPIELKIDLDQGEFDLKSDFKLDEAKKKQVADYAIEYTPTKAEIDAHTKNGEFDMKGYMTMLAQRLFSAQIQKSVLKQALAKDRETFTEQHLKNSTLRNNSDREVTNVQEDFESAAMRA